MEEDILKLSKHLLKYFKQLYCRAIKSHYIDDNEERSLKNIYKFVKSTLEGGIEPAELYENLKKSIFWYLYIYHGKSQDGTIFGKQLRFLFDGKTYWLIRLCLENVISIPLEQLEQSILMPNVDMKRAIKRGDVAVYTDKAEILENCLSIVATINKIKPGFKNYLKNLDEFRLLYKTQLPDDTYLKKAETRLNQFYENLANI